MMPVKIARHVEAKLFMARRAFKHDVLRILLSEFDDTWKQTSLGIKVRYRVNAMSVIIMSTEPSREIDFVT